MNKPSSYKEQGLYKSSHVCLTSSSIQSIIFTITSQRSDGQHHPPRCSSLATVFLFSCAAAHPPAHVNSNYTAPTGKPIVDVVVEGMVYCQNCTHHGTWSLAGADPIAAAKVSVICRNYKNRVTYYKTFETDPSGYFYGELKGFKMVHPVLDHPLHGCHVKLVSSPLATCEMPSNINYGMDGASLRYEDKRVYGGERYEAVVYAAGPLAFRPASCPHPQTHA